MKRDAKSFLKQFAESDDYVRRYGDDGVDFELLDETLQDATRKIKALLELHNIDYSKPTSDYRERLMQVCRDMAYRAVQAATSDAYIPFGATQFTTSADGFSEQIGFQGGNSSGYGELYITKSEKQLLGIGKQRIGTLSPLRGHHHARH